MTKHKSEDFKLSAVKYFLENKDTQENTCKIFKCSVISLLRWTKRYKEEKEIKRKENTEVLPVWDMDKGAWRAIRYETIKEIRFDI